MLKLQVKLYRHLLVQGHRLDRTIFLHIHNAKLFFFIEMLRKSLNNIDLLINISTSEKAHANIEKHLYVNNTG